METIYSLKIFNYQPPREWSGGFRGLDEMG